MYTQEVKSVHVNRCY